MRSPPDSEPATRFYRIVMHASAAIFLGLSLFLFLAPRDFLGDLGLDLTPSTDLLCRRASVLLLGLSVLSFLARNAASSVARQALVMALFVSTGGMAAIGLAELVRGTTTVGILKPMAVETTMAVCFMLVWLRGRTSGGR